MNRYKIVNQNVYKEKRPHFKMHDSKDKGQRLIALVNKDPISMQTYEKEEAYESTQQKRTNQFFKFNKTEGSCMFDDISRKKRFIPGPNKYKYVEAAFKKITTLSPLSKPKRH